MQNNPLARFFRRVFGSSKLVVSTQAQYKVCESIASNYSYHLQLDNRTRSICGKPVMHTAIPLSAWGHVGELKERWCEECANKMRRGHKG